MKVIQSQYDQVLDYLEKERWNNGMEVIAYPNDGLGIGRNDLLVYANMEEANSLISVASDNYEFTSIRSVIHTMREGKQNGELIVLDNGLIDVGQMMENRFKRLDSSNEKNNNMETKANKSKEELLEDTIAYNKDSLKYMGFKGLDDDLEKGIRSGQEKFSLAYRGIIDNKMVQADLHFRNGTTRSFWNSYELTTTDQKNPDKTMSNIIYLDESGRGLSLKKAFNQLEGRAAYAQFTGEKIENGEKVATRYYAWEIALLQEEKIKGKYPPHKFNDKYGFTTEAALKDLDQSYLKVGDEYKKIKVHNVDDELTHQSLKTGNRQGVRVSIEGNNTTIYVEANPGERKLDGYAEKIGGEKLEIVSEKERKQAEGKLQGQENTKDTKADKEQGENKDQDQIKDQDKGKEQGKGNTVTGEDKDKINNRGKGKDKAEDKEQTEVKGKGKGKGK